MNNPDSPVINFTKIVSENKGFKRYGARKIAAVYIKLLPSLILAPIEKLFFNRQLKRNSLSYPPLYILGHWRSGTSFTQFLLNQDPQLITPTKFETLFPDSFLVTEPLLKPLAVRFIKTFNVYDAWKKNISVSMDLDSPSEVDTGLVNEASLYTYHWGHFFPKSWDYYFERNALMKGLTKKEMEKWKKSMLKFYRKVQLKNPQHHLLIKNPPDTGRVSHLLALYPDAKFVFVYRNPYQVFYSNVKLWNNITSMLSMEQITYEEIREIILSTYVKLHEAYLAQKKHIPAKNLVEIKYEDMLSHPMKVLEDIYEKLEVKDFQKAKPHFQKYLDENLRSRNKLYEYQPEDIRLINSRWDFAFKCWDYEKHIPQVVYS